MLSLILPPELVEVLLIELKKAGRHEVGGILMGEHVGLNEFKVTNITVHRRGGIASYVVLRMPLESYVCFFAKQNTTTNDSIIWANGTLIRCLNLNLA